MNYWPKFAVAFIFLFVHWTARNRGWYYTHARIDMLTHLLGGLTLGAFLKDIEVSVLLIFSWELIEMILVRKERTAFKENPLNKLSDLFFGLLGFIIGFEML